jgi:hypothetical protein
MSDFVEIGASLLNWIQNERVSSYNEGVDMILSNARTWMAAHNITAPTGEHIGICDLLNAISDHHTVSSQVQS